MDEAIGYDHTLIVGESATQSEVEGLAPCIGDTPTGFHHDEGPGRMVPDLFDVVLAGGQPQVNAGGTIGHHCVFALRVDPHRWCRNTE